MLVSGWAGSVGWTKVVRAYHLEGEIGEEHNVGFIEQTKGLCRPYEETLGVRSWRSCVPENDSDH